MFFIYASSYILSRKCLLPTLKLTQQLTVNRSRIIRRPEVRKIDINFPFSANQKPSSIASQIRKSIQRNWSKFRDIFTISLRFGRLAVLFGPILLFGGPLYICGCLSSEGLVKWIRWSLSMAGATFIKLGQWAATRPDVLPSNLCDELAILHSNAPCHEMSWNEEVIMRAFGRPLSQVFEDFEATPIGSGTIAQVHRARMKNNRRVAVKITHPGIEQTIGADLLLLSTLAWAVDALIPAVRWISLPEEVACFAQMMQEQVNLRFEAFTLHRFGQNFKGAAKAWGHVPRIGFPRPHFPWVSSRCLVEDLIEDSVPIGKLTQYFSQMEAANSSVSTEVKSDLASLGLRGFLQMLLWDNFVHADLHPGNILVRFIEMPREIPRTFVGQVLDSLLGRVGNLFQSGFGLLERIITPGELPSSIGGGDDGVVVCKQLDGESPFDFFQRQLANPRSLAQLVFLDTGLVTELSRPDFKNFTDLFQALVLRGDGFRAGELMIDRSPGWAQGNVIDRQGFCVGLADIVAPIFARGSAVSAVVRGAKSSSLGEFRIDLVLHRLFQLARKHHVRIDAAYTNLVMSLLCVEGLGRQLAPEMDLRPLLAQAALQYLIREH